ncbi:MAG: NERD domain-containing protein [Flavobacterium sp.]|uniref:NERD domain-containing protein n=1 Tax=Flavobacterium sp. TaxID=239 RepID=UPI003BE491D7
MPIHFIDNYPKNNLESVVINQDGDTLFGELWLYKQFLSFNENKFIEDETWYLKHNYNLSTHPASKRKVEGQVDFILLTKQGLLIIEVKGGGLRVDENDCYFSSGEGKEYETQNPFTQAKEYVHTFKKLIDSSVFVYRAIVLPHEAGFVLRSPQLAGYKDIFFSKANITGLDARAVQNIFFKFINELGRKERFRTFKRFYPTLNADDVTKKAYENYPLLCAKDIKRLKSELFPTQSTYGYNPDRINSELILKENYEILKGLRRNRNVIVQGAPGTGKTALAVKYLAENLLKQQKGIVYCANKLIRARLEHIILNDYKLDPNNIAFRIFSDTVTQESVTSDVDFLIFDEAQEYFDKGLYDFIEKINIKLEKPKILVLYDPEQAIVSNLKELAWYTDFFIEMGYTHFYFDENYRCAQNKEIAEISNCLLYNEYGIIKSKHKGYLTYVEETKQKLQLLNEIVNDSKFTSSEKIILVQSHLLEEFTSLINDYFNRDIEELNDGNINITSNKIRYTSPIKYRGLETESVYLITKELNDSTKVQNYVGATRAMNSIRIILWK